MKVKVIIDGFRYDGTKLPEDEAESFHVQNVTSGSGAKLVELSMDTGTYSSVIVVRADDLQKALDRCK